jgi:hypothetical protein
MVADGEEVAEEGRSGLLVPLLVMRGQRTTVDDKLLQRKPVARKSTCPKSSVGGLARGRLLHIEGETVVLFSGVVIVERLRWRCTPVNRGSSKSGKQEAG